MEEGQLHPGDSLPRTNPSYFQNCCLLKSETLDPKTYSFMYKLSVWANASTIPHICHFFSTYPIVYKNFLHAKARKSRQNESHKNSVKQTL